MCVFIIYFNLYLVYLKILYFFYFFKHLFVQSILHFVAYCAASTPVLKVCTCWPHSLLHVAEHAINLEVEDIFEENEVDEIWITFPDPQIKFKRTKHRLTNPTFLDRYRRILQPEGRIHLKTDSEFLHGYTLGLLQGKGWEVDYAHHDVYGNPHSPKHVTAIQTHYERLFMEKGRLITYLSFRFPNA